MKKKSMSFCLPPNKNIQNEIINSSHQHMSGESELFAKIKKKSDKIPFEENRANASAQDMKIPDV